MAQLLTLRLSRHDAQPWGFRLQGGKDFGTPLIVQKVNGGSIAEQAGLIPGDAVIKINNIEVFNLRHKDAQDIIVRSGNTFDVTIQRGGSTWRPAVTPVGGLPAPSSLGNSIPTVTKTSLAHRPQEVRHIGSGYNNSARPFSSVNGSDGQVKSIVNKQYNSPVGIYSEEAIAETLSAQAEVLAGGVLGVNFKKNEKVYNAANSEVYKFLHEQESEPSEPAEKPYTQSVQHNPQSANHQVSASVTRHVSAPIDRPKAPSTGGLPAGQNICAECERLIVGVFVRVKDRNLHVDCFKCATCGTSLKNQGYYNFNNKLYCDIHAKLAAMNNPPPGTEGYVPVPIKPNTKLSANTISAAINAHHHQSNGTSHLITSPTSNVHQGYGGPKPFGSAPKTPPISGPRSPSTYPPPSHAPSWGQPKPATNPYATLPRTGSSQGRFHTYKPGPTSFNRGASKGGVFGATSAPKRGRGILNKAVGPGARIPLCGCCHTQVRGPFITALGRIWCPEHFICVNANCRRPLQDIGFVEEKGDLYCEYCFEKYLAPTCSKCNSKIKGDCLNAIGKHFHPECFTCSYCGKLFGNSPFFLEEGEPYCEADWNELFTTKCFACGFPVEAGDRWVEALNHNYHSQCFNCTMCKKNLEGQSFYNKGGRPFCKNHAR